MKFIKIIDGDTHYFPVTAIKQITKDAQSKKIIITIEDKTFEIINEGFVYCNINAVFTEVLDEVIFLKAQDEYVQNCIEDIYKQLKTLHQNQRDDHIRINKIEKR